MSDLVEFNEQITRVANQARRNGYMLALSDVVDILAKLQPSVQIAELSLGIKELRKRQINEHLKANPDESADDYEEHA